MTEAINNPAVVAVIVSSLFGLIQWVLNRVAAKNDKQQDNKAEEFENLKSDVNVLQTTCTNLLVATRTSMYDRIKWIGKSYIHQGWVHEEDYEDLKRMHGVYHNELGGNGYLDDLMDDVKALEKRA